MESPGEVSMLRAVVLILVVRPALFAESLELSYQDLKRLHQLQKVKDRILSGLHLDDVPNLPSGLTRPNVQKALSQLHKAAMAGQNPNLRYPENLALILFSEPPKSSNDKHGLQFQLTSTGNSFPLQVKSVSLYIRLRVNKMAAKIPKPKSNKSKKKRGRTKKIKLLIQHFNRKRNRFRRAALLKASVKKTKWLKINIPASAVEADMNRVNQTTLLRVQCKRCKKIISLDLLYKKISKRNKNNRRPKFRNKRLSHTRPFLVIHTKPPAKSRLKRNLDNCSDVTNTSQCCSREMYVDFSEIGWDNWILYPPGFTTTTCDGGCTVQGERESLSNQASRHGNISSSGDTSCRPRVSEPLTVIYQKRVNAIVRRTIPDLVDRNCSCGSTK